MKTSKNFLTTYFLSVSLILLQLPLQFPAFAEEGGLEKLSFELKGLSKQAQTSEVTATALGELASQLQNHEHKTNDIVMASAGGAGYVFSITAATTAEQGIDTLLGQFTSANIGNLGTEDFLQSQIDSMTKSLEVLFDKYEKQSAQASAFYWAAYGANVLIKKEQTNFKLCTEALHTVIDLKEDCPQASAAADEAYNSFDDLIHGRESIIPSLDGKKGSEALQKVSKAKITAITTAQTAEVLKYEEEKAAAEASENVPEAAELGRKEAICKAIPDPAKKCTTLFTTLEENEAAGKPPGLVQSPLAALTSLKAGDLGGYNELMSEMGPMFDKLMLTPFKRTYIWRILGELSNNAAMTTSEAIYRVQDQLDKANGLLVKFQNQTTSIRYIEKFQYVLNFIISDVNAELKGAAKNVPNPAANLKLPCPGSGGSGSCVSLATILPNSAGFRELPNNMKNFAMKIARYGDAVNASPAGLKPRDLANLRDVSSMRVASLANLKNSDNLDSKNARSMGYAPFNVEGMKNAIMDKFNGITNNVLEKRHITPARYLSSHGITVLADSRGRAVTDNSVQKIVSGGPQSISTVSAKVGADTKGAAEEPLPNKKFNYKNSDISSNHGDSLFEIISNRYVKSFLKLLSIEGSEK